MVWRIRDIAAVMALILGTGCVPTTDYVETNTSYSGESKASPNLVDVVTSPPDRPFVEVGIVSVKESSAWNMGGDAALIEELKEEGARRGCDAVWIRQKTADVQSAPSTTSVHTGTTLTTSGAVAPVTTYVRTPGAVHTLEGYQATCLVYRGRSTPTMRTSNDRVVASGSRAKGALPREVSLFVFGAPADEARKVCESGGGNWSSTERAATCAGHPSSVLGMKADHEIVFCGEKLCGITITLGLPAGEDGVAALKRVVDSLEQDVEAPTRAVDQRRPNCITATSLYECLSERVARIGALWRFDNRDWIKAELVANEAAERVDLVVSYRKAKKPKKRRDAAPEPEAEERRKPADGGPGDHRSVRPGPVRRVRGPESLQGLPGMRGRRLAIRRLHV
jgi:hypothetical protein